MDQSVTIWLRHSLPGYDNGNYYIYRDRVVVKTPVRNIVILPPTFLATPALDYSGVTAALNLTMLQRKSISMLLLF
jgi:hypothetical protein